VRNRRCEANAGGPPQEVSPRRRQLSDLLTPADDPQCPRGVERRKRTADDHPHDGHGAPSAAELAPRTDWNFAPTVVVNLDVADLTEPELRQEILKLRRRVQKLAALLRLVLVLLQTSGLTLSRERLPDGRQRADPARHRSGQRVHSVAGAPAVPLHAVIDKFSRRILVWFSRGILAWRIASTCAPVNRVARAYRRQSGRRRQRRRRAWSWPRVSRT
jgi:hypothetical protein